RRAARRLPRRLRPRRRRPRLRGPVGLGGRHGPAHRGSRLDRSEVRMSGETRAQSTDVARQEHGSGVDAALPERFENPGMPPHKPRLTDEDPAAARRATRQVAALFGLSMLGTVGFVVAYALVRPGETVES